MGGLSWFDCSYSAQWDRFVEQRGFTRIIPIAKNEKREAYHHVKEIHYNLQY